MASILNVDKIRRASGTVDAIVVDSGDRVSSPKNPALYAHTFSGTDGTRTNGTSNTKSLTYSTVVTNDGSCWNNATGEFTCPVAGRYYVTADFGRRADSTTWFGGMIEHNTTKMAQQWEPPANPVNASMSYLTMSVTCIVDAAVNDTIAPLYFTNYSDPETSNHENSFTVMYIG
jgi:hypothetical protein